MTKRGRIPIRCDNCGNATMTERADYDPPEAVEVVTNSANCPVCDQGGGWGDSWYTDRSGNEIRK
jgi:hypothetical protein